MRLDKFLSQLNMGTRSQVRDAVRQGDVKVNGVVVKSPDFKVLEETDQIIYKDVPLVYQKFVYYMLNKPQGVVSATKDNTADTVLDLLTSKTEKSFLSAGQDLASSDGDWFSAKEKLFLKDLFPVGRLDKDTEGLLIITNDGELAHRLLSPKKHVDKTYLVGIRVPLSPADIKALENGVDIGDDKPTKEAKITVLSNTEITLTIHEGRFHQVKRMLHAVGNEVLSLKRIQFGKLKLDESLMPGESRLLTKEEVDALHES
ncbi:MAG: rRNA pseudouridine synthase [Bacteroidales bacterium]|nr:rRNA pseudouridine synthase [Lachnoclostridium sp.]MCM1384664.1 rRNA pseudouridine synthase [Lachnoclostridium sp.]MCM1463797.1 rRNA pseudouridine synthase [Bacteroidales bacterium]